MDGKVRLDVFSETFTRADVIDIQPAAAELPTGLVEKVDAVDDEVEFRYDAFFESNPLGSGRCSKLALSFHCPVCAR
jgi:hypothetical protein